MCSLTESTCTAKVDTCQCTRTDAPGFRTEGFAHISIAIGAVHAGTTLSSTGNDKDHQETSAGPCALCSCCVACTWPYALLIGNSCCTHRDKGHQVSLDTAWASRWDSRIVALSRRDSVNFSMPRVASFCFCSMLVREKRSLAPAESPGHQLASTKESLHELCSSSRRQTGGANFSKCPCPVPNLFRTWSQSSSGQLQCTRRGDT